MVSIRINRKAGIGNTPYFGELIHSLFFSYADSSVWFLEYGIKDGMEEWVGPPLYPDIQGLREIEALPA